MSANDHCSVKPGQSGATTLTTTLLLLAIVTVVVLFATNTAFFEMRTTTNENRARLAEQAAEYAVNLGGEYVKSKLDVVVSTEAGGWLEPGAGVWARCVDVDLSASPGHPCLAEANAIRRNDLYFATLADDTDADADNDLADRVSVGTIDAVGGDVFDVASKVDALLCRIDTSQATPRCRLEPETGNNIAVTLIATAAMGGEDASATVKETWGSYGNFVAASAVPLVASGAVEGLGNAQIVAAPDGGGSGLAASVWSPQDVDFEASSGGGVGSVSTCHLGGYLGHGAVDVSEMLDVCPGTGNTGCGCPGPGDPDFLSGHGGSVKTEGIDILDIDGGIGDNDLPDITFYPGQGLDNPNDPSDDNLFEWIFNVAYVAEADPCNEDNVGGCSEADNSVGSHATVDADCGADGDENCAVFAMREDLGFEFVTCDALNALGTAAEGLYYVEDSSAGTPCTLSGRIGSPDSSGVIVVVNEELRANSLIVFGMLFVRSDTGTAQFTGNGNAQIFGSAVVEGSVNLSGGIDIVYYDWAAKANDPSRPPPARSFGRVSGSWLDDDDGF